MVKFVFFLEDSGEGGVRFNFQDIFVGFSLDLETQFLT